MFYSQLTFVLQPVLKDKYIALMHGKYKKSHNSLIHFYVEHMHLYPLYLQI